MGNKSSSPRNDGSWRQSSMTPQSNYADGWQQQQQQQHDYGQSSVSQYSQNYPVQHPSPAGYHHSYAPQDYATQNEAHTPPRYSGAPSQLRPQKKLDRRYSRIADNYNSLEEVTEALAHAGLESSNLIVGIDFTKSNEWTGRRSYNGRSLHHIDGGLNPYEQAISIIGKTLVAFDDDNLIPCFGFGDASTHDQDVFSFHPDGRFCHGFEEVLSLYREIVPNLRLAGPTSFAPIIEMATTIVEESGGQYHVLLIIADGQVTRSVDTQNGRLSPQERQTVEAIVNASKFPLSIILVGVGDGPWDMMREFDDNIPARDFDNFQFVNFTEIMSKNAHQSRKETEFALSALMEVPTQYKATMELSLLGQSLLLLHLFANSENFLLINRYLGDSGEGLGMPPNELLFLLPSMVLLLVRSQSPQRQRVFNIAQVHTTHTMLLQIHLLLLLRLLQPLFMKIRYVRFALLTQRTWPLVAVIRHAVIVANTFNYAQSAAVQLRPESSCIEVAFSVARISTPKRRISSFLDT